MKGFSQFIFWRGMTMLRGCQVGYNMMCNSRERADHEGLQLTGVRTEYADRISSHPMLPFLGQPSQIYHHDYFLHLSQSFLMDPISLSRRHNSRSYLCYMSAVQSYIQDCSQKAQKGQRALLLHERWLEWCVCCSALSNIQHRCVPMAMQLHRFCPSCAPVSSRHITSCHFNTSWLCLGLC